MELQSGEHILQRTFSDGQTTRVHVPYCLDTWMKGRLPSREVRARQVNWTELS
jgi:hypothetical protein